MKTNIFTESAPKKTSTSKGKTFSWMEYSLDHYNNGFNIDINRRESTNDKYFAIKIHFDEIKAKSIFIIAHTAIIPQSRITIRQNKWMCNGKCCIISLKQKNITNHMWKSQLAWFQIYSCGSYKTYFDNSLLVMMRLGSLYKYNTLCSIHKTLRKNWNCLNRCENKTTSRLAATHQN